MMPDDWEMSEHIFPRSEAALAYKREDSISTNPDSIETEAESISPRSMDSLAAVIGYDKVDSAFGAGAYAHNNDNSPDGLEDNKNDIRTAFTSLQAIAALSLYARKPEKDSRADESSLMKEPWISALERRDRISKQPKKRYASPGPKLKVSAGDETDSEEILEEQIPPSPIQEHNARLEAIPNKESSAPQSDEPEDDFDPRITSKYELEAFLEQEEELRDGMRRKDKQTRLAFSTQVRHESMHLIRSRAAVQALVCLRCWQSGGAILRLCACFFSESKQVGNE
jgi:hypothetical protein